MLDRTIARPRPGREDPDHTRREPPAALATTHVLALQRTAGNQAVTRLMRAAHAPAHDTYNNYAALLNGLDQLVTHWRNPVLSVGQSNEADLLPRHRALLVQLRSALVTLKTSPGSALSHWEMIVPSFDAELRRAGLAGLPGSDVDNSRRQLGYLTTQLFRPGAYQEAKQQARETTDLENPDSAFEKEKAERAEQEFNAALTLLETTKKLGSGLAVKDPRVALASELIEVVALKGGLEEKLEYARKHGLAVTAADLTSKLLGATKAMVKVSAEIGEKIYEARRAAAAARGAEGLAKQLEGAASRFKKMAETAEKIGKVANAAALIGDYIRLVAALADGDYDAAAAAGLDLATDAAPLVFGADVAGPLAVAVITVKAELEAFRLAAAFIRWCKDENVRQAAGSFVEDCDKVLKGGALNLVADCEILLDPTRGSLHALAEQQAISEGKRVADGLRQLNSHVLATEPRAIGAYGPVVRALGTPALTALQLPFADPLLAAQQCRDVFHGANAMARYVKETYTN